MPTVPTPMADDMATIKVALVSGRCESFSLSKRCCVSDLTAEAKVALQIFTLQMSKDGKVLDPLETLSNLDGQTLTAIADVPLCQATDLAFMSWSSGNGLATWGDPMSGGASPTVQLKDVEQVWNHKMLNLLWHMHQTCTRLMTFSCFET